MNYEKYTKPFAKMITLQISVYSLVFILFASCKLMQSPKMTGDVYCLAPLLQKRLEKKIKTKEIIISKYIVNENCNGLFEFGAGYSGISITTRDIFFKHDSVMIFFEEAKKDSLLKYIDLNYLYSFSKEQKNGIMKRFIKGKISYFKGKSYEQ